MLATAGESTKEQSGSTGRSNSISELHLQSIVGILKILPATTGPAACVSDRPPLFILLHRFSSFCDSHVKKP
jgi:hypothetical protein